MGFGTAFLSNGLLFALVFCMSATVDFKNLIAALSNRDALMAGLFLQFFVLPFLGFCVVKSLDMPTAMGISLLVVTSSPGGSYSNWWCSMFNADLALSVTMTAISTLVSVVMLPVNLLLYTKTSFDADVVSQLDWGSLFISIAVVTSAIGLGLFTSAYIQSFTFNLFANKVGNFAGIGLVIFSVLVSTTSGSDEEVIAESSIPASNNKDWKFYFGVAAPCVLALLISNIMTTLVKLEKPSRVTVSVESCYQNVGIGTSVALSMFKGEDLADAIAVPLYYGALEAVVLGIYCFWAWKAGWTKAPPNERFCTVISTSYEVKQMMHEDLTAIEVVYHPRSEDQDDDLDFEQCSNVGEVGDEEKGLAGKQKNPESKPSFTRRISRPFSSESKNSVRKNTPRATVAAGHGHGSVKNSPKISGDVFFAKSYPLSESKKQRSPSLVKNNMSAYKMGPQTENSFLQAALTVQAYMNTNEYEHHNEKIVDIIRLAERENSIVEDRESPEDGQSREVGEALEDVSVASSTEIEVDEYAEEALVLLMELPFFEHADEVLSTTKTESFKKTSSRRERTFSDPSTVEKSPAHVSKRARHVRSSSSGNPTLKPIHNTRAQVPAKESTPSKKSPEHETKRHQKSLALGPGLRQNSTELTYHGTKHKDVSLIEDGMIGRQGFDPSSQETFTRIIVSEE